MLTFSRARWWTKIRQLSWVKERVIVALRAATGNVVRLHLSAKRRVSHDTGEMSAEYA